MTDLNKICRSGDLVAFNSYVESHAPIDLETAFAGACYGGHEELIDKLINMGATDWDRGFVSACIRGHAKVIQKMLVLGANHYLDGLSMLCRFNHPEIAKTIIPLCDRAKLSSVFLLACTGTSIESIKLLISYGCNDWNNGLVAAALNGNPDIINLLISHGANDWNRGLVSSCTGGHLNMIRLFIDKGASRIYEALCHACKYGHYDVAMMLIEMGPFNLTNILKDIDNTSKILLYNSIIGDPDKDFNDIEQELNTRRRPIILMLIERGADINECSIDLTSDEIFLLYRHSVTQFGKYQSIVDEIKTTDNLTLSVLSPLILSDIGNIVTTY